MLALGSCADTHFAPSYRAFGDSITYGYTLSNRLQQAFPFLVAKAENMPVTDYGLDSDMACDIAPRQIFPSGENPSLVTRVVSSILIGTNDADHKGVGAYEQVFRTCHLAAISWQAVPAENKVLAGSSGFETSGPGKLESFGAAQVWTTQGSGSSMSFAVQLEEPAAIYAWPVIDDSSDASFSYSIGGVPAGSATVRTSPAMATTNGTTRSLGFLRFPGLGIGRHVITFTQTSSGSDGVSIVGIAAAPGSGQANLPIVLVGTAPFQLHPGRTTCCCIPAADEPCLSYIQDTQNDVALLAGDGLNVRLFDTRNFMLATAAEMNDSLHPNALGHQKLAEAVESVWPASSAP